MAGYVIADVDVHDMDALDEYHKIAGPSLEKYGGRVIVGHRRLDRSCQARRPDVQTLGRIG